MPRRPLDVLEETIGEDVSVLLKDGTRYAGTLVGYDQHLNVVLEDATSGSGEHGEGEATVEDTIVIRGDNVVSITP